jgi:hypothetical protein
MMQWISKKRFLIFSVGFILVVFYLVSHIISENKPNELIMHALLIGGGTAEFDNSNHFYENIEYVASSLKQMGYDDRYVKILFYGGRSSGYPFVEANATKTNVIAELRRYEEILDENDSLLIFRSGHGIIELVFDTNGILMLDEKTTEKVFKKVIGTAAVMIFPDGSMSYIQFQEILGRIKAKQIIVILNQCYSGQFTEITTIVDNTVIVSETDEVGIAFYSKRKTKRWKYEVWPFVKCIFDGFLSANYAGQKKSVLAAFEYMLLCNPNVEGLCVKADRPLLKETPQIKYGKRLTKGAVYID